MPKAERDYVMTHLRPAERDHFRRLIQDMRTQAAASSGHRRMARQVLAAHSSTASPALRAALEAVVVRDEIGPQVATCPPGCALKQLGTAARVRLSSFRGQQPVGLVFGRYTWPPFGAQVGRLEDLSRRYHDPVTCFVVSVQEAHHTDGWQVERHVARGGLFPQHQRDTEREAVATTCRLELHLSIPVLIEEMHNAIDAAYSVAPARLYLIEERPCHLRLPHPSGRAW